MEERILTVERLRDFVDALSREEKSSATCEKYLRDVRCLMDFAAGQPITKELTKAEYMRLRKRLARANNGIRQLRG